MEPWRGRPSFGMGGPAREPPDRGRSKGLRPTRSTVTPPTVPEPRDRLLGRRLAYPRASGRTRKDARLRALYVVCAGAQILTAPSGLEPHNPRRGFRLPSGSGGEGFRFRL